MVSQGLAGALRGLQETCLAGSLFPPRSCGLWSQPYACSPVPSQTPYLGCACPPDGGREAAWSLVNSRGEGGSTKSCEA